MESSTTKIRRVHLIRLDRGEDFRSQVEAYAREQGIVGAHVTALGAIRDVRLGYYELDTRSYLGPFEIPDIDYELVGLVGNIAMKDNGPFLHAHATIGNREGGVYGGHLFDARCAVTLEVTVTEFDEPIVRSFCEDIGLAHWTFPRDLAHAT